MFAASTVCGIPSPFWGRAQRCASSSGPPRTMYYQESFAMSPADFVHALSIVNERLKAARTVAISLLAFAGLALAGAYGVRALEPGMAKTMAAIALIGGLGAIVVGRILNLHRTDILDDILLSGFRHVGGPDVGRRAAELVHIRRRRQLADTLERFVEVAATNDPCSVPLHRPGAARDGAEGPGAHGPPARAEHRGAGERHGARPPPRHRRRREPDLRPGRAASRPRARARPHPRRARDTTGSTRTTTRAPSFGSPRRRALREPRAASPARAARGRGR